ncbi:MAG: hypothetical protein ACRBCS_06555 [Cellvibrionaceae bacterium]
MKSRNKKERNKAQIGLKTHARQSHNVVSTDEKLIALVKLLARIEAQKDFQLYLDAIEASNKN